MAGQRTEEHRKMLGKSFTEKSKVLYPDQLQYNKVEYYNETTKVTLVCNIHGDFQALPKSHLTRGKCCKACAKESYREAKGMSKESFLSFAGELHKNVYSYPSLGAFVNNKDTIEVVCPKHGMFLQKVGVHKGGSGCSECAYSKSVGGYNNTTIGRLEHIPNASVYLLSLKSCDGENFFKVGITTNNVNHRIASIPIYSVEILQQWQIPLDEAFELEQFIIDEASSHKPENKFGGHTECFNSHAYCLFTGETT